MSEVGQKRKLAAPGPMSAKHLRSGHSKSNIRRTSSSTGFRANYGIYEVRFCPESASSPPQSALPKSAISGLMRRSKLRPIRSPRRRSTARPPGLLDRVPARASRANRKSRVVFIILSDQIDRKIALEPPPRVLTSQARRRMLHLFAAARNLRRHE